MAKVTRPSSAEDYRFMNAKELAVAMNLSVTAIRSIARWGGPFVSRKSHPRLLIEWMAHHPEKVLKLE